MPSVNLTANTLLTRQWLSRNGDAVQRSMRRLSTRVPAAYNDDVKVSVHLFYVL